jgi:hypothetical protein
LANRCWRRDLPERRKLCHDVILNRICNFIAEQLPPLRHSGSVASNVVLLGDVTKKLWMASRNIDSIASPCGIALIPFTAPCDEFIPKILSATYREQVGRHGRDDVITAREHGPINGPKIWPKIEQHDLSV